MAFRNNSLFDRLIGRFSGTVDRFKVIGGSGTKAGESVNTDDVLREATVFSCIQIIAQGIAQLPIKVVDVETGLESKDHPEISQLLRRPNDTQSQYDWVYNSIVNFLGKGQSYSRLKRLSKGSDSKIKEMVNMDPNRTYIAITEAGIPIYTYEGLENDLSVHNILHVKDVNTDSPSGEARVTLCKERIGALMACDALIGRIFKDGINMNYIIKTDKTINPSKAQEYINELKKSLGKNSGNNFTILDKSADVQALKGLTPADADLRAIRKDLINEIAGIFRIPPFMVGGSGDQKYSNVRQLQSSLYRDTFIPILTAYEQAMTHRLLPSNTKSKIIFDVSELLKGDVESTANVAMKLHTAGIWTADECREYTGKSKLNIKGVTDVLAAPKPTDPNNERGTDDLPNSSNNDDAQGE